MCGAGERRATNTPSHTKQPDSDLHKSGRDAGTPDARPSRPSHIKALTRFLLCDNSKITRFRFATTVSRQLKSLAVRLRLEQ
jgi:hypothetical protein